MKNNKLDYDKLPWPKGDMNKYLKKMNNFICEKAYLVKKVFFFK